MVVIGAGFSIFSVFVVCGVSTFFLVSVISDFFDEFLSMENEILNIINQEMPVILKKMIWYIENENSVLDKQKVMAEIENDNLF